ncbi:MAG: 4Fe-4S binding protein [Anaerolineales bacterium]
MELLSELVKLDTFGSSPIAIDPARCLRGLNQLSHCQACRDVCPARAIGNQNPPGIELEACLMCRACLPVCPTGAIQAHDVVTPLMKCAARASGHSIDVLCEHHPKPETGPQGSEVGISIRGCLAAFGVGGLLQLGTSGLKAVILRLDHCKDCELRALQPVIEERLESIKSILDQWNQADVLSALYDPEGRVGPTRAVWDAENPPLTRREIFRLSTLLGRLPGNGEVGKETASGRHLNPDRKRIVDALGRLYRSNSTDNPSTIKARGFFRLSISEECTACGNCSRTCPTEALIYRERNEKEFRFIFKPQMCIGCELCARICPVNAIDIALDPDLSYVFFNDSGNVICQEYIRRCVRCGTPIVAETRDNLCMLCKSHRENPYGMRQSPFPYNKP